MKLILLKHGKIKMREIDLEEIVNGKLELD